MTMLSNPIETVLRKRFSRIQIIESRRAESEECLLLRKRHITDALQFLQTDPDTQLDLLVDISALHYTSSSSSQVFHSHEIERPFFEVFYLLRSTRLGYRARLSFLVAEEMASIPSLGGIYPNASWLERELWDLFGIFVEGHPDLRRLLLASDFDGHPLRKDYEDPFQS